MRTFTIREIINATGGKLIRGSDEALVRGFSVDSRETEAGGMFFATVGARNDAHDFIKDVIKKGCKSMVISNPGKLPAEDEEGAEGLNVILADDVLKALQDLAKWYLGTLPLKKKIAITGSVGKTSTRDMMYYVASTKYKTGRNKKNYNSDFGLPLSILDFEQDTEIAVLEMGMYTFGEIKLLADIVRPDIGIITNIAEVNIEGMKNIENILKAKMEIVSFFGSDSVLIVNQSCPMLSREKVKGNYKLITVDTKKGGDYFVSDICDFGDKGIKYILNRDDKRYEISLAAAGGHNALNASLAIAAGELIGISPKEAAEGLKEARLTGTRLKVREANGFKVIDDTYNACEDSVKSAINTLIAAAGKRKIAVLGDIIGLGHRSEAVHRDIGKYAADKGADMVIAIGKDAKYYAEGAAAKLGNERAVFFPQKKDFKEEMAKLLREGDVILVKASRGMELEEIAEEILKDKKG